jgi:nitroimidazol reductase NimA-like FMN-containing flavoprotein (pyridoxamine 5'-phosphate oxidase superfamily)
MNEKIQIIEQISSILKDNKYAVLSTVGDGQPHASIIAVTWLKGYRQIIFVTYRGTRKHSNISNNCKVAVLVESGNNSSSLFQEKSVLTAFGVAEEIRLNENEVIFREHLERHPDLLFLSQSKDCALMHIIVDTYQVVHGVEDVKWLSVDDMDFQTP